MIDLEAAEAFEAAAVLAIENPDLERPEILYYEAYKTYYDARPKEAARCLQLCIKHYTDNGNYRTAAAKQEDLAKMQEALFHDTDRAIEAWELAGDWYKGDRAIA